MTLTLKNEEYTFQETPLFFEPSIITDVFARLKNKKTLGQTIQHRRYAKLALKASENFANKFTAPIGEFLLQLKSVNDPFYREFLNPYGDLAYCRFRITDQRIRGAKGLYLYSSGAELLYIGRCLDSFGKRINSQYGNICPKKCYLDGNATNCKVNAHIAEYFLKGNVADIQLKVCTMSNHDKIKTVEVGLIDSYKPPWNNQHAGGA
jgi:hypothetical protein